jgi:hypothetical protein
MCSKVIVFTCNEYGHKDLDCTHYVKKDDRRFNNMIRCWNTRRKSMRNVSYSMARRTHEERKGDNIEKMEAQSSSSEKPGHS